MSGAVLLGHGLLVASGLFVIGLLGVLVRQNLLLQLLSVEIMLNSAGLAFVLAGARWGRADGQVLFIFILTMAAAEVAVGLALLLRLSRSVRDLDGDAVSAMRG
jgi:NADH-quinone oxidoreductase subunit K